MAKPTAQSKIMSSRLSSMKFMKRAANASLPDSPTTPTGPPSKKQRLSNGAAAVLSPETDAKAIQGALTEYERDYTEDLDRAGAEAGGTKWVLNVQQLSPKSVKAPLRIKSASYAMLDAGRASGRSSDEDQYNDVRSMWPSIIGRRSFGKFNNTIEEQRNPDLSSSDDSSSSVKSEDNEEDVGDEDGEYDVNGVKAFLLEAHKESDDKARAELHAKNKAEKAESLRLAEQPRSGETELRRLKRISSGGRGGRGGRSGGSDDRPPGNPNIICYACGEQGHIAYDCPSPRQRRAESPALRFLGI